MSESGSGIMLRWDVEIIKMVCLGFEGFFFPGWTLKLNTSDPVHELSCSLLAALMENRPCSPTPQQKGQHRGPGKNVNVDLMVLCLRDVAVQEEWLGGETRGLLAFFFRF